MMACLILCSVSSLAYAQTARTYAERLCQNSLFRCYHVRASDTWVKRWPDPKQRDVVMRLNRMNMPLRLLPFVIVPRDFSKINYRALSPLPLSITPTGHKEILVDLDKFAFAAYDPKGDLVRWGPVTSGQAVCAGTKQSCATVTGEYHIYRIQDAACISRTFPRETGGGAPMPWCMHYYRGYAIHASTLAGFVNKSQGCIRLFRSDAMWLNQTFAHRGTRVVVRR